MKCIHINQITQKINDFRSRIGDHTSIHYRKLASIVNKEDIEVGIDIVSRGIFTGTDYKPTATYKTYDFNYIPDEVLVEFFNEISNLIDDCDCYEETKSRQTSNKKRIIIKNLRSKTL